MQQYGSFTRLTLIAFRQNANDIQLTPNTGTTYTATRTFQLPTGDANKILGSNPMTTAGDLIYGGASGIETRLAAGTATQVLHGGTTPTWAALNLATDTTGILAPTNGGTGVANNAASTLTISGAFATTLTVTATTSVTLPTTGTLATLAGTETFTNKSISGSTNTFTNISLTTAVTGILPVANGGTGASSLTANNVILGNGTSPVQFVAPGTSGNVLTSNGTTWTSAAPAGEASFKDTWVTADTATKAITHNLGTLDVMVQIYDIATGATILIDSTVRTDANTLTVTASEAPPAGSWRVLIEKV